MEITTINNDKAVLIIGGLGNLGSALCNLFLKKMWNILVIDHKEQSSIGQEKNTITINGSGIKFISISQDFDKGMNESVYSKIELFLQESGLVGFNCLINAAGGFESTMISNSDFVSKGRSLIEKNYISSLLTANLACKYLCKDSLIIFSGSAKVFKESCPDLLLFQCAKTAMHSVALTLKDSKELPENVCIITILPEIFDTPQNRQSMPLEDVSKWTNLESTADLLYMWAIGINLPRTGSFALLKTKENIVIPDFI